MQYQPGSPQKVAIYQVWLQYFLIIIRKPWCGRTEGLTNWLQYTPLNFVCGGIINLADDDGNKIAFQTPKWIIIIVSYDAMRIAEVSLLEILDNKENMYCTVFQSIKTCLYYNLKIKQFFNYFTYFHEGRRKTVHKKIT
jgi:hypothetical protein